MWTHRGATVLARSLLALATFLVVLPAVTLLGTGAAAKAVGYSVVTAAQVPFLLSVLYWAGRLGTADSRSASQRTIEYSLRPSLTEASEPDSSRDAIVGGSAVPGGPRVTAFDAYFLGLGLGSALVVFGVVP